MKKIILSAAMGLITLCGYAQLQDNAVVPVSVTLNSILRLNVTSGGNIQFVFNTMADYNNGIIATTQTTTTFTVSSSRAFTVYMGADDATFQGIESGTTIPLGLVQYTLAQTAGVGTIKNATANPLLARTANDPIVTHTTGTGVTPDTYTVAWDAGVGAVKALNRASDVYVTNVYLTLVP